MKIAYITGFFDSTYYSSNEYSVCNGMAKLGHDVVLFTSHKGSKWQSLENRKICVNKGYGFAVTRIHAGPEIGIMPMMPTLLSALLKERVDIVHSHEYFAYYSFQGLMASKMKRCPFVITQHNDQLPASILSRYLYLLSGRTMGKYTATQTAKIVALTNDIKNHLVKMGVDENKIVIVPNAVDTERFTPNKENFLESNWKIRPPVVLFVGRLVEEKGVESLLRVFTKVAQEAPESKLVIVGNGPLEEKLSNVRKKLDLPRVFFLGAIRNDIMPNIYAGADVVVLPSTKEPFGNVVIEAMACGKPVIGSFVGGMKDTIVHGYTGYHVQIGDNLRMQEYIVRLLTNTSLRETFGKNARERAVREYSQDKVIKSIEKLYYSLS